LKFYFKEEHGLKLPENRMLKRILGPKKNEVGLKEVGE
jgi:hypothetical protein